MTNKHTLTHTHAHIYSFSTATFFAMTHQNSVVIPLTFMVELTKSIPVSVLIRERFQVLFGAGKHCTDTSIEVSNKHFNGQHFLQFVVLNVLLSFCLALFLSEQPPVTQVSNLHINQLISQSKARQEGKEVLTDKWRLVVR